MKAGFVQFEPRFGKIDENLRRVERLIHQEMAELLVLPELFNTGYLFTSHQEVEELAEEIPDGKTTRFLCELAGRCGSFIVGGLAEREGDRFYNSAVLVSPRGYVGTYRKIHLFSEEKLWFSPGDLKLDVFDLGCCRIGIMICFDWFFPETTRILALQGADVICHCANLVLPYCQEAWSPDAWRIGFLPLRPIGPGRKPGAESRFIYREKARLRVRTDRFSTGPAEATEECHWSISTSPSRGTKINPYNRPFRSRRIEFTESLQ